MNTHERRPRARPAPPTLSRLPPLTSLRAFVATARHLSFTRAADELHVTSAAIGQQIRLLEDYVGHPLFLRNRGELELTDTGLTLMPGLTEAFDRLLATMARLTVSSATLPPPMSEATGPHTANLPHHQPKLAAVSAPAIAAE